MNYKTLILLISTFLGVSFGGYLVYEQKGKLETTDFVVLGITLIFGLSLIFYLIKKAKASDN
jgi:hypothetical protein